MIIDTHSHIYQPEFKEDLADVIDRAVEAGVNKILLPNVDSSTMPDLMSCADSYPDICFPMTGLHPTSVNENYEKELQLVKDSLLVDNHFVAVGEIGLDLYWDKTFVKEQMHVLDVQIELAIEHSLPVVIHCREAFSELFNVLSKYKDVDGFRGVVHSFTGSEDDAAKILEYKNLYIGINGIVTFKKSHLPELVSHLPVDRILPETDSPYLTPVPHRGKRNESAYVVYVIRKLSEIFQMPVGELSDKLNNNAKTLFGV